MDAVEYAVSSGGGAIHIYAHRYIYASPSVIQNAEIHTNKQFTVDKKESFGHSSEKDLRSLNFHIYMTAFFFETEYMAG